MAKPSPMIQKLLARERAMYEIRVNRMVNQCQAMCQDAMAIAVNEILGIGENRIAPLMKHYVTVLRELERMISEDHKQDSEVVYAKAKIDERCRKIYGEMMPPFDVRWGINCPEDYEWPDLSEAQYASMRKYLPEEELSERAKDVKHSDG